MQRALHFDLDPSMTVGQGHEILRFCELFLLTGSSVVLLSWLYVHSVIIWYFNTIVYCMCSRHYILRKLVTNITGSSDQSVAMRP